MLKRILSYIFPITLLEKPSPINGILSVTMLSGKLILNSPNTDYSYGSLQRVLRFGLQKIGFEAICRQKKILVLGLAAGSVVRTLVDEIGFKGEIHGVDIDPEVVEMGKQYFALDKIPTLQIFIIEAQDYLHHTKEHYDMVVVDIFEDDQMPDFLFTEAFFTLLSRVLTKRGTVLFNTLVKNKKQARRNASLVKLLEAHYQVTVFPKVEEDNELLVLRRAGS